MELSDWGRLHPILVHLPIGFLLALALLEIAALLTRSELPRRALAPVVFATAVAALLAAGAGWLLQSNGEYAGEIFERHRIGGFVVAGLSLCAWWCHRKSRAGEAPVWLLFYRLLLFCAALAVAPTGHYGGSLTHGKNYLDPILEVLRPAQRALAPNADSPTQDAERPLDGGAEHEVEAPRATEQPVVTEQPRATEQPVATEQPTVTEQLITAETPIVAPRDTPTTAPPSTYASVIAPIFEARCTACHGESKRKGALALHTPAAITEGSLGDPVVVPGDASASVLMQRVRLPLDHEDHMPPENKPQLTEREIALLGAWVDAGAPFEQAIPLEVAPAKKADDAAPAPSAPQDSGAPAPSDPPLEHRSGSESAAASNSGPIGTPPREAVQALRDALWHVEELGRGSGRLWISCAALAQEVDDEKALALLTPLAPFAEHVDLSRSQVGAATLSLVARMPHLAQLNLSGVAINDSDLASLVGHPTLAVLRLARTQVSDASLETLASLEQLESLYLWQTQVSPEGFAELARQREQLHLWPLPEEAAAILESSPDPAPEPPSQSQ